MVFIFLIIFFKIAEKQNVKSITILLIFILNFPSYARQPAVLPGRTLSTDQYSTNLPKNDKFQGYQFLNKPTKNTNVVSENLERMSAAGPQSISIYLTIFALLFPFGLWLINNRSLKDENDLINKDIGNELGPDEQLDNVIELGEVQNEQEGQEEETDEHKKAS